MKSIFKKSSLKEAAASLWIRGNKTRPILFFLLVILSVTYNGPTSSNFKTNSQTVENMLEFTMLNKLKIQYFKNNEKKRKENDDMHPLTDCAN